MIRSTIFNMLSRGRYGPDFDAALMWLKKPSYLKDVGWFVSLNKSIPVDKDGAAVPWYTYGAIDFLSGRISREMAVFEYGSGNSTIWWAERVSRVVSCEHDEEWFLKLKEQVPDNVQYIHQKLSPLGDYSRAILQYDKEFDIIVLDGRNRVNCAKNCLCALTDRGVIVWDNSDRDKYEAGYDFLIENGFKRLDFKGIGPINTYGWCTSMFYKTQNCLGL